MFEINDYTDRFPLWMAPQRSSGRENCKFLLLENSSFFATEQKYIFLKGSIGKIGANRHCGSIWLTWEFSFPVF